MTSKNQSQTQRVFTSMWNEHNVYYSDSQIDQNLLVDWSNGKLSNWLQEALPDGAKVNVLDAGCGLGNSFSNLARIASRPSSSSNQASVIYTGVDLIPLDKTEAYLRHMEKEHNFTIESIYLTNEDMSAHANLNQNKYDLVVALGTLHHTDSVKESLEATLRSLKKSNKHNISTGYYLGWIINQQKPLRHATDKIFREYFNKFDNITDCRQELRELSCLFKNIDKALEGVFLNIPRKLEVLDIEPGKYKLQSFLYDYIFKCYYRKEYDSERNIHQIFDWFNPINYHQTSEEELYQMLSDINLRTPFKVLDIVTKTNGHFFFLQRQ